jgi:hypothetical protein
MVLCKELVGMSVGACIYLTGMIGGLSTILSHDVYSPDYVLNSKYISSENNFGSGGIADDLFCAVFGVAIFGVSVPYNRNRI